MDKAILLTARLPEQVVALDGVGEIRVRGLSRAEALELRGVDDTGEFERRMLALAMVDPQMSQDDVAAWQRAALPGEIEHVTGVVVDLSGMGRGSAKSAVDSAGDDGAGV